jgi:drug/metabolite transporter (DMT)-like permease
MSEIVVAKPEVGSIGLLPYLGLAFGIVGLGMSALFVRWAHAPGPVSGFYRVGIAAMLMALPAVGAARRQSRQAGGISRRHLLLAMLAGLFFAGDLSTWNTSVLITNAANATLLGNTAPVWVSLGALILFKEKLGRVFWAGLALAMLGAVVILGGDFLVHPAIGRGDVLATIAGVFYGCFLLTTQHARAGLSSLLTWWVAACVSTTALLAISLLLGQPIFGYPASAYLSLVAAALVSQLGGYLSLNYALGHLPASVVSPTLLLQPVLTAVLAVPLLGEGISWGQVLGGVIVLVGIWIIHRSTVEPKKAPIVATVQV